MELNYELIEIRVKGFLYDLLAMFLLAGIGLLTSPEFQSAVGEHWGTGITSMLILAGTSGLVKHLRNLKVIQDYESKIGSDELLEKTPPRMI